MKLMNQAATYGPQYLTDKALAERYAVHRVTIWRWVREGRFPSPVSLGPNCKRWKGSDVDAWENAREAA